MNLFKKERIMKKNFPEYFIIQVVCTPCKIYLKTFIYKIYIQNTFFKAVTAGILQETFFDVDQPKYMNYGGIGSIIGHEITHAFDVQSRNFDENGNFLNWWDTGSEKEYSNKSQCFIDQYNKLDFYKSRRTEFDGKLNFKIPSRIYCFI